MDDSRSMADNGCGAVALEAVTLLARALARLEVGEIGVLRFGGASGAAASPSPLARPLLSRRPALIAPCVVGPASVQTAPTAASPSGAALDLPPSRVVPCSLCTEISHAAGPNRPGSVVASMVARTDINTGMHFDMKASRGDFLSAAAHYNGVTQPSSLLLQVN